MDKKTVRVAIIGAGNCAKLAVGRRMSGPMISPPSYFIKTHPKHFFDIARDMTEVFNQSDETK